MPSGPVIQAGGGRGAWLVVLAAAAVTLALVAPPGTKPAGDVDPEARHCLAQSM